MSGSKTWLYKVNVFCTSGQENLKTNAWLDFKITKDQHPSFFWGLVFPSELRLKPRTLYMLGNLSTTESHPLPFAHLFLNGNVYYSHLVSSLYIMQMEGKVQEREPFLPYAPHLFVKIGFHTAQADLTLTRSQGQHCIPDPPAFTSHMLGLQVWVTMLNLFNSWVSRSEILMCHHA